MEEEETTVIGRILASTGWLDTLSLCHGGGREKIQLIYPVPVHHDGIISYMGNGKNNLCGWPILGGGSCGHRVDEMTTMCASGHPQPVLGSIPRQMIMINMFADLDRRRDMTAQEIMAELLAQEKPDKQ